MDKLFLIQQILANDVHNEKYNLLNQALMRHDFKSLALILSSGVSVNEECKKGSYPIHTAAWFNNPYALKLLLDYGADRSKKSRKHGRTALHSAIQGEYSEVVKVLLAYKADINAPDNKGYTPLHYAVFADNKEIVKMLVEDQANCHIQDIYNNTPLKYAIDKGYTQIALLLLENENSIVTDEDLADHYVHLAIHHENIEVVKALVSKVIKSNYSDNIWSESLGQALSMGNLEIIKILIETCDSLAVEYKNNEVMHYAAGSNNTDSIDLLIEKGLSVDAVDDQGETPLFGAIFCKAYEAIQKLIEKGVNVNHKDNDGSTPLHEVIRARTPYETDRSDILKKILELLIKSGAHLDAQTLEGQTPLHLAVRCRYHQMVELLIKYGARNDIQDNNGETPLDYAKIIGDQELIHLLTDININNI